MLSSSVTSGQVSCGQPELCFFIVSAFVGLGYCLLLAFAGECSPMRNSAVGPEYVIPSNH